VLPVPFPQFVLPPSKTAGPGLVAYSDVIDLVGGPTGAYVVLPPTAARLFTIFYGWELKTVGGTRSVAPTFSAGSNSTSFNNLFASQTVAAFTSQAAETVVLPTLIGPIPTVDLTTSGLNVNVTALATGATPVLTARLVIQFQLLPV
jgi:hypothetical protein